MLDEKEKASSEIEWKFEELMEMLKEYFTCLHRVE